MEGELLEYLDFYYDDDPSLMNPHHGLDKSLTTSKKRKAGDVPPIRKKRKIDRKKDANEKVLNEVALPTGRGIAWRTEDQNELQLYEPGNGEKVALLKDWRTLFKAPIPKENNKRSTGLSSRSKVSKKRNSDELQEFHDDPLVNQPTRASKVPKKKNSEELNESPDAPAVDKPTRAPQLVNAPLLGRRRSSLKPSPLKHSMSSADIPSSNPNANSPKKKAKSSLAEASNDSEMVPGTVGSKKRRKSGNDENEPLDVKRRAMDGRGEDDKALTSARPVRQTRSRKAAGA
jgi:hypothetical protein